MLRPYGKSPCERIRNRRFTQCPHWQLSAQPVGVQLLRHTLERMSVVEHLHRAISADHQQASRFFPACKESQQVKGRYVTPAQVFQHENHWLFYRQPFQCVRQLTQHAFT